METTLLYSVTTPEGNRTSIYGLTDSVRLRTEIRVGGGYLYAGTVSVLTTENTGGWIEIGSLYPEAILDDLAANEAELLKIAAAVLAGESSIVEPPKLAY